MHLGSILSEGRVRLSFNQTVGMRFREFRKFSSSRVHFYTITKQTGQWDGLLLFKNLNNKVLRNQFIYEILETIPAV